jgi:hypothetical protein
MLPVVSGAEPPPFLRNWVPLNIDPAAEPSAWTRRVLDVLRSAGDRTAVLPLELGMAVALGFMGPPHQHDWLVLIPEGHASLHFVTDLRAYDLETYDGSTAKVVAAVMKFLLTRKEAVPSSLTPRDVVAMLGAFDARKQKLNADWEGKPRWADIVLAAKEIAKAPS